MQQGGDQINRDQNNNTLKQQEEQRQNKEMSAAIMQQPTFRRTHEEGKLPSLSSMLPPLPPFNPRLMTSPKDRFGRSSFRNYSEDGGQLPSFMSGERLSPPSQRSPQIGFSNSPPLSAKTRIGSDNYSIEEASTASSSSLRAPSQHIYRSRTRSSAMPYEVGLPSPSAMDIFHQLWDMMLEIRRHYEHIQSNNSSIGPRPLPSIRDGDVTTLMSHLQYEIDILSEHDARVADHYALDVRHLYEQYMNQSQQQQQNRSARGSSTSVPHRRGQSQFGNSQPVHCSSSLSPPTYTLSASAPRSRQITPSSSSVGNEHMYSVTAPASAPAYGRNQEGFQQSNVYDHVGKSQIGSWYDNRHISSAPPSPQDNVRQSTVAGSYYHHAISGRTPPSMPRRVRKRRDEAEQSCLSCSAKETPEWRKGPTGPRTLCNACGLLFAKQCRKREMELQARGKRPKGARVIGPEEMTQEERENSLLELQMAVQARVNQTTSNVSGLPTMATSSTSPSPGGMTSMNGNHTSHPNYFNSHPNHHSHHHHPQPPPPQQQQQHQHQHPSQHNNHRLYGSPSLERSPPSATGNAGGGSSGDHHISLPRLMSDQSHPPPPSLPPLLRH